MALITTQMRGMNVRVIEMATISEVASAFYSMEPESSGNLGSVVCAEKGKVYLVGFEWAIYGEIDIKSGVITFHSGWLGYSNTSTLHIRRSGIKGKSSVTTNEMPEFKGC